MFEMAPMPVNENRSPERHLRLLWSGMTHIPATAFGHERRVEIHRPHLTDGEVAKVRAQWVDDEYGDRRGRSDNYPLRDGQAAYTFLATEILSVIP
jgi:hypothetical protein